MRSRLAALTMTLLLVLTLIPGCGAGKDRAAVERLTALQPEAAAAFESIRIISQKAAVSGVTDATYADYAAAARTLRELADRYSQVTVTAKTRAVAAGLQAAVHLAADKVDVAVTALREGKQDLYWTNMAGTADALASFLKHQAELDQLKSAK